MSDIISGTARGAGRAVTLAIAGLLVMASLGLRLSELDRFMTPDEMKWACRSVSFYRALASGDLAGTLRTGHPGVITMWLGVPWMGADLDQDWLGACANPSLADLIKTNPRGTAARLGELTFAARRGVVALTSLAVGVAFLLLTCLCGRRTAFVASLFVLLDPFLMAHSRFLHLDAIVTSLLFPSLLCLAIGLREGKRWFLAGAGALGALAALNKSPAMFVAPFALAVMGVAWLLRRRPFGELLRDALAYGLAFALTYMALWPSLWVRPLQTLQTVFGTALFYASNPHTNSNYFLGAPRPDPGIAFYPVALLFRLTPWVACALPLVALPFIRRDERRDLLGILASFALLYGAFMTVGQKKFDRYLLPVLPAVQTLAAIALLSAVRWLLGRTRLRRVEPAATLGVSALALVLAQVMVLPHAPYYLTYYSSLLGGADAAVQTILVGWGEGLDEAARYLNALPDAADRTVVVRSVPEVAPFFAGLAYDASDYDAATTDYVVLYVNEVQRQLNPELLERYWGVAEPIHVVRLHGIDYAWVYENRAHEPPMAYIAAHGEPGRDAVVVSRPSRFDRHYHGDLALHVLDQSFPRGGLAQALQGIADAHERVWYVRYAEKNPNPTLAWLDFQWQTHAYRTDQQAFTDVDVFLWDTADAAPFVGGSAEEVSLDLAFGDTLWLAGYRLDPAIGQWGRDVGLIPEWRVLRQPDAYYAEFVHVLDDKGRRWGQGDRWLVDGSLLPTVAWEEGSVVREGMAVTLVPGIPPGEYQLVLGLYDRVAQRPLAVTDSQGREHGDHYAIGTLVVAPSPRKPSPDDLWIPRPLGAELAPGLDLLGWNVNTDAPRFGEELSVSLYWRARERPGEDYAARVALVGEEGASVAEGVFALASEAYPSSAWGPGEVLWRTCDLEIPADAVAEAATLVVTLEARGAAVSEPIALGQIVVEGHHLQMPEIPHRQEARIGESIHLLGFDLAPTAIRPGESVALTLYWRTTSPLERSYTVFTHFVGPDGSLRGQDDSIPLRGWYPTDRWRTDETIVDRYLIPCAKDAPPGRYAVHVGMYDPAEGAARLPLYGAAGQRQPDDRLILELAVEMGG